MIELLFAPPRSDVVYFELYLVSLLEFHDLSVFIVVLNHVDPCLEDLSATELRYLLELIGVCRGLSLVERGFRGLRRHRDVRVSSRIGVEGRHARRRVHAVIIRELGDVHSIVSIVLYIIDICPQVCLERRIHSFRLLIRERVICRREEVLDTQSLTQVLNSFINELASSIRYSCFGDAHVAYEAFTNARNCDLNIHFFIRD